MFFPLLYSTMLLVYSHIHLYTDKVEDLSVYKSLEKQLNEFGSKAASLEGDSTSLVSKRDLWKSIGDHPHSFTSHNQDVVKQLMVGFGFRVTGARYPSQSKIYNDDNDGIIQTNTRSVLVTSSDPTGAKFIVTAIDPTNNSKHHDSMHHFDAKRVQDYFNAHNNRQGIAVLAFEVDDLQSILDRYNNLHPKLFADHFVYDNGDNSKTEVLEVYAYYKQHNNNGSSSSSDQLLIPDTGTILRFIQVTGNDVDKNLSKNSPLPGLIPVAAKFDGSSMPAYSVRERTPCLYKTNKKHCHILLCSLYSHCSPCTSFVHVGSLGVQCA